MKPVILGDGLLGAELYKQTGWNILSRKKDKIEANNINKEEEIKKALDYINYDLKKFLETPYTTEDNV
jgi:hypothetical protein